MSRDRDDAEGAAGVPDQQSAQHTGAGASTAMQAMLKKRGMQTHEPDGVPPEPAAPGPAPARKPAPAK